MSKKKTTRTVQSFKEIIEYEEEPVFSIQPLRALDERQQKYLDAIHHMEMILCKGIAGSGKTYLAVAAAAEAYTAGKLKRLYLARPAISSSKSLGFFGGGKNEKVSNWIGPMTDILLDRVGKEEFDSCVETGIFVLKPIELVKGLSLRAGEWLLVDEAEDLTEKEAFNLATRSGTKSKTILMGDVDQKDVSSCSGLDYLYALAQKSAYLRKNVGMFNFDQYDDCKRGETCKQWLMAKDGVTS